MIIIVENKNQIKKNDIHVDNFDSSKHNFNDIKISSPVQNISTNNKDNYENSSTIKYVAIEINNRYQKLYKEAIFTEIDDKKFEYKNDNLLCKKLYNYIKLFIRLNSIKNYENNIYVKDLLIEIENVNKEFGICKNIVRDG